MLRRLATSSRKALALLFALSFVGCSYPRLIDDEGKVDEPYLQRVIDATSRIRGVPLERPLRWQVLTGEKQRTRLSAEVAALDSAIQVELLVYKALGLVAADYGTNDLATLVGDGVAAHYDTSTKTFYLVPRSGWNWTSWMLEKDVNGEFVASHEVTHAL